MPDMLPPRRSRRLPLSLTGTAAVLICAGCVWVWLGRQWPDSERADGLDRLITLVSLREALFPAAVPATRTVAPLIPPTPPADPKPVPVITAPVALPVVAMAARPLPVSPSAALPASSALAPSFDIVRVAPTGEAVLAGRAAPGTHVTISDNGQAIALATADNDGQWVALPTAPLPPGGQTLTLSSTTTPETGAPGGASRVLMAGAAPLLVVVPPKQAAADPLSAGPLAAGPLAAGQTAVAVLTPANAAPRVLQGLPMPKGEAASQAKLGLDVVDYDRNGAIRFAGSAPPGVSVRAYIDNRAAGDALADADGNWSFLPDAPVLPGDHRLRVDQLAGGKVTARVEVPFERTALTDVDVGDGRIVVQPRETLWRIARRTYGEGIRYTVIFQANRDQIRDPDRIFPGQVFDIPPHPAAIPAAAAN